MADTEARDPLEHGQEAGGVDGVQEVSNSREVSKDAEDAKLPTPTASKPSSRNPTPALPSPGSGLVPLRGGPGNTTTPTLSMPHPKRFSHVDINKRFLEKNSQASSGSHPPAASSVAKTASAIQKPALQTAPSHSRLVTAKLTADTTRLSTTGPGWSRPSSTNSSVAAAPASGSSAKPTPAPASSASHGTLPTPPGKIIQPQPRSADSATSLTRKDSSGKPAWRSPVTSVSTVGQLDGVQNEFPTAAEVAQVNSAKLIEKKQAAQVVAAQKEVMTTEADAFRGVHLGMHHWDEDEGDDSNFLDEVIEFDDGRQYTIPHVNDQQQPPGGYSKQGELTDKHERPVSKEERFADDFDRSWPRSRHPNGVPADTGSQPMLSPSATSSQSLHSPQDSSRVLFNERSNRLEPYSSHPHGRFPGPPREPSLTRRGGRSDTMGSPVDLRGGRDAPPHTAGVQLLQKPPVNGHTTSPLDDVPSRSRIFGDRPGFDPSHEGSRLRDREFPKRDVHSFGNRPPHGPDHNRPKDYHNGSTLPSPIGPPDRPRRYSNMGPPPVPGHSDVRDGRQLPPHLADVQPPPHMWRDPSNSERPRRLSTASSVGQTPVVTQSPVVGQTPVSTTSQAPASHTPATPQIPLPSELPQAPQVLSAVPIMDLEEARKAAMHSAAERAKLRRQQEEEEREKERERARKKAAELEARLKAAGDGEKTSAKVQQEKVATEAEAVALIEDAVRSIIPDREIRQSKPVETSPLIPPSALKTLFSKSPSSRGSLRPVPERLPSISAPSTTGISPATEADTWRSKVVHQPPPPVKASPSLPLLEQVDSFSISMDDSVEIVDFSEHGKLVGVSSPEVPHPFTEPVTESSRKSTRPRAADFFQDDDGQPFQKTSLVTKADEGSWRKKPSPVQEHFPAVEQSPEKPKLQISPTLYHAAPTSAHQRPLHVHYDDQDRGPKELAHVPTSYAHVPPALKSPVTSSYREAPMSALDDTMARIRGALDGMHKPPPNQKWLPPALRARPQNSDQPDYHEHGDEHHEREVFDVTGCEPPRSPKPAWNHFTLKMPHAFSPRDPVPFKRLRGSTSYTPVRFDTLSLQAFGNGKRLFQITDLLFAKPYSNRGRVEYRVSLPQASKLAVTENGLVVNLPASARLVKSSSTGAFGRPREADGASSWRKPTASPLKEKDQEAVSVLDTISRSPPPEPPVSLPGVSAVSSTSPTVSVPVKSKVPSKVPNGSGVGFYRDSRGGPPDGTASAPVKFIVSSELEAEVSFGDNQSANKQLMPTLPAHEAMINAATPAESKMEVVQVSTSSTTSPWAQVREIGKESTTTEAIPEHLRSLWTSKSNKTTTPSENLLEGLTDDVPFTIRDAKLEEPPTVPVPAMSRMSSQDVARAFQQVPNSPANAAAAKTNGSSTNSQPIRQPAGSMLPVGVRPVYSTYPPSMMSSPSPTLGYPPPMTPSPVPRPMVAASPYGPPPMWVAMPPPPNGPPGMMRSPYGPQLMPYPPPGVMPMYPHHHHHPHPPPPGGPPPPHHHHPNGMHGRPPPPPGMMSPVPPQAQAMYATSPVMMPAHAIPGMLPPGTPYSGPGGRPLPPHQRGAYDGTPGMMQQSASFGSQPASAYPFPSTSYPRTPW
ncbi:hypothetical protein PHLGIDRAFT_124843 [Phlebiopsis gigantea 11061_1 CR5-6]|uniref:Uncharacterized protein n=1 Tax=Phlebiopsis gigantea (strain 11061_1 CR5-6) TaxID=745531 RepID=A0A0C3SF44_PHLG1|nr:hypothetical protein PHLGIDRAFT_124843 [Phlebiopsis gigantea 11061_1 CR5-6]